MTLQLDIVITTLSFLPATGYKTPSALCSAFFTISELFIYVPPFLSILLPYFCGINQLVSTNSFVFMIAQRGGNVNRIGAAGGGKGRKIPIQRGLYRWFLNYTLFDKSSDPFAYRFVLIVVNIMRTV